MLAVGDSTRLEIIFNTGHYTNMVGKVPTIVTNEGSGFKTVRINAFVTAKPDSTYPIVLKPAKLDLTQTGSASPIQAKVVMVNVSGQKLIPTLVSAPRSLVGVVLPNSIPAGGSAEMVVKLKKNGLNKAFDKSITIELNDQNRTRFTLPVRQAGPVPVGPVGAAHL